MPATYMLRKRQRELDAMKTPEAIERRNRELEAGKKAELDLQENFPNVTQENFVEADAFHKERLIYWNKHFGVFP